MKNLVLTLLLIATTFFANIFAQEFQGQAYYQTQRKVEIGLDDNRMTDDQKAKMQAMLKKQFERTFILTFNKEASIYKEEESLETPQANVSSGGIRVMSIGGGGAGLKHYKNTKTKTYAEEEDLFGKPFLVKDSLRVYNWELTEESKVIGKYLCFKAVATFETEGMSIRFDSDTDEEAEKEETIDKREIVAWYTPEIPVSNGPDDFWGLPGLILELHDGDNMSYLCTKVVLNSKDKTDIKAPTKGKQVTADEYEVLMREKIEEMQKNFGGRERKGEDGGTFSIRIGG